MYKASALPQSHVFIFKICFKSIDELNLLVPLSGYFYAAFLSCPSILLQKLTPESLKMQQSITGEKRDKACGF